MAQILLFFGANIAVSYNGSLLDVLAHLSLLSIYKFRFGVCLSVCLSANSSETAGGSGMKLGEDVPLGV